jgi:hypothetical protein
MRAEVGSAAAISGRAADLPRNSRASRDLRFARLSQKPPPSAEEKKSLMLFNGLPEA